MSISNISAPSVLPGLFSQKITCQEDVNALKKTSALLPLYNVCFVGHVDSGKSTTIARLLFDTGRVSPHVFDKFEKEASALNKQSFKFAWLLDSAKAERQRGITISLAHAEWSTDDRYFTLIDAPGHADFMKNMITGASQADLAVLLIDAQKGLVEGLTTEEHLFLVRGSGVTSLIIALNKFNLIPHEHRLDIIKERVEESLALAKKCGFNPQNVVMVPVNSFDGWNLKNPIPAGELDGWVGPTLLEALNDIPLPQLDADLPLRISIENTFGKIGGTNIVVAGKVMSGVIYPGQEICVKPANVFATVRSIEMHNKSIGYGTQGANIGIDLKGIKPEHCTKASIISDAKDRPAKSVKQFTVKNAIIKKHPTALVKGSHLIIHYQTGNCACEVLKIADIVDLTTGKQTMGEVNSVAPGNLATITLKPDHDIVIEPVSLHPRNCRVMLRDSNSSIGLGVVSSVVYSDAQA
jgi:elongation factor 1-alpha